MKIFWENIIRYSKFLITSLAGLIFFVSKNLFALLFFVFGNYANDIKLTDKKIVILLFLLTFFLVFFLNILLSL
jgi:hypothetical protein